MFDPIFDTFRKATESTMQIQQEMLRQWINQWTTASVSSVGTSWTEQVKSMQRRWLDGITELMNKHRETLDSQYRSGIRAIEDAFRVTDAKTPEDFRRLTEDLWRKNFDMLRSTAESQMRDFQSALEKWFEVMSKMTRT